MYWHHPFFLFLYPFWPFYLFTKEKKNLGAACSINNIARIFTDGDDYKIWLFILEQKMLNVLTYITSKSWNIFKKRPVLSKF